MDGQSRGVQNSDELGGFSAPVWTPRNYQLIGIDHLLNTESGLCFLPGLGKTSVTLQSFMTLRSMGLAKRMLVLAPLMVCRAVWRQEAKKWDNFRELNVGLAHGRDRLKILLDRSFDVVVLNYEGLQWAHTHLASGFEVLVCDELTCLKHTNSKRFKYIKPQLSNFKFRWGLTGTLASNSIMDVFGQTYVLDMGQRLGRYITSFRAQYFDPDYSGFGFTPKPGAVDEILSKVKDLYLFVRLEDALDLPDFIDDIRIDEFDRGLYARYKFFEDEFLLNFEDDTVITAVSAGALSLKLRQFVSGAMYDAERNVVHVHDAKLEMLDELLDEMQGEPLMVAYQFDHERARILARHPDVLALSGGMSTKDVDSVIAKWNTGKVPMLLVQPQAASKGLNLQVGGHHICWFSLTFSLEDFDQLNARLRRQGQTKTVVRHFLAFKDTVDERVSKALARKDATQNHVNAALTRKIL